MGKFLINNMALKTIIFDMDGTLIDSGIAISNTVNYVRTSLGMESIDNNSILKAMNDPYIHSPSFFYKVDKFLDIHIKLFQEYYDEHCVNDIKIYDGIYDLIKFLKQKDVKICVATNAHSVHAKKMLKSTGLLDYFDYVVCADMVKHPKPSPDMIEFILKRTTENVRNTILIGDSLKDKMAADNAGIESILVNWGFTYHKTNLINDVGSLKEKIIKLL